MIHLDTNFLIDALLPGSPQEAKLVSWQSGAEAMGFSSVAWGEFLCGPLSRVAESYARRIFPHAEPLERADAEKAAELFNQTGRRSKSYADCCIAGIAIRAGAALASSNEDDFSPMIPLGLALA